MAAGEDLGFVLGSDFPGGSTINFQNFGDRALGGAGQPARVGKVRPLLDLTGVRLDVDQLKRSFAAGGVTRAQRQFIRRANMAFAGMSFTGATGGTSPIFPSAPIGGSPTGGPFGGGGGFLDALTGALPSIASGTLGLLAAREQRKAAEAANKASRRLTLGGGGVPASATPFVGAAAGRVLPSILGGAAGSVAVDTLMNGEAAAMEEVIDPASVPMRSKTPPKILQQVRRLKSGRLTVDTYVRAPKEQGTLRVVRSRRRRCRPR